MFQGQAYNGFWGIVSGLYRLVGVVIMVTVPFVFPVYVVGSILRRMPSFTVLALPFLRISLGSWCWVPRPRMVLLPESYPNDGY